MALGLRVVGFHGLEGLGFTAGPNLAVQDPLSLKRANVKSGFRV